MSIKRKLIRFVRKIAGTGYVTPEDIKRRGGSVGERCAIYTNRIDLAHAYLLTIGNDVTLSNCRILMHDASIVRDLQCSRIGKVTIGDKVFIGAEAIVLPNVKIGSKVIIGAGAVVTKDIPDNSVAVGNPALVIGSYDDYIKKHSENLNSTTIYKGYQKCTKSELLEIRDSLPNGKQGYEEAGKIE